MIVRQALSVLLAALSLTVLAPAPAFACSCDALTTAESVDGSDAVFLGTARMHDVRVDEVFAGMLPSSVALSGAPDDTAPMGVFADVDRWQVLTVGAGLAVLLLAGIAVVVVRKANATTD